MISATLLGMSVRQRRKQAANDKTLALTNITDPQTDPSRWRLRDVRGRQTWHYLSSDEELKAWPMSAADKWYLGLDTVG